MQAEKQWNTIGFKPHHGIAVPLFSLWSQKSSGIGEFLDLIPLIDWCQEVGFDVIQLLPLNDTGGVKSPYSAISAFALNPIHLRLEEAPPLVSTFVDYGRIIPIKENILRERFRKANLRESSFVKFKEESAWLEGFAAFKAGDVPEDKDYHAYVQYLCFKQMQEVKEHADKKGVLLKGDIPILLSKASADVFLHEDLFINHLTAGAPPDAYAKEGQSWGFPLYNWDQSYDKVIEWWQERLRVASELYHLYRLDHVVGLFRIWAIPEGKKARDGFFVPKEEERWLPQGTKILESFLSDCPMLPIAEDLGTVPLNVKEQLMQLGIPGTKVFRWEMFEPERKLYSPVSSYPKMSMTTVSTHDTETLKGWWHKYPTQAKGFCEANGLIYKEAFDVSIREELLALSHRTPSIFHINQFQEYFPEGSGLEFEDEDNARVNDPADQQRELNWAVRYKAPLEEIINNKLLRQLIRKVLHSTI